MKLAAVNLHAIEGRPEGLVCPLLVVLHHGVDPDLLLSLLQLLLEAFSHSHVGRLLLVRQQAEGAGHSLAHRREPNHQEERCE